MGYTEKQRVPVRRGPISYLIFAVVITVTIVTSGIILYAVLTGKTGDPGVERDE